MIDSKSRILVTCPKAIPPILAQEIRDLCLPVKRVWAAGVETEGGFDDCMRLNLWLRTGHRVLFLVREFNARNADELYRHLVEIPWENLIPQDGYLSVTSSVENPTIRDTRFAGLKCKDAIVDRIKSKRGQRPDSGPNTDRSVVFLYWRGEAAAIYIDTSGDPLPRRGYRRIPLAAPMQETLAAAVVLSTGWRGEGAFLNPMCGSGTLAIEAALISTARAPGLLRDNFGFMHIAGYDEAVWKKLRREAGDRVLRKGVRIIASDRSGEAIDAARENAVAAQVDHLIDFDVCDFARSPVPGSGGVVVFNPGYGERMGDPQELKSVYWRVGEFLKKRCRGYRGFVFTGNPALAQCIALRPSGQRQFFNSNIECRLLEYEIF